MNPHHLAQFIVYKNLLYTKWFVIDSTICKTQDLILHANMNQKYRISDIFIQGFVFKKNNFGNCKIKYNNFCTRFLLLVCIKKS